MSFRPFGNLRVKRLLYEASRSCAVAHLLRDPEGISDETVIEEDRFKAGSLDMLPSLLLTAKYRICRVLEQERIRDIALPNYLPILTRVE